MTAVLLALASALAFATATVVQHRAATDVPPTTRRGARVPLLLRLAARPAWLVGQATAGVALVLHAAALRAGAVVLVQPLLSSGLVFALAIGALVDRRHPARVLPRPAEWWLAGLAAAGLCLFLLSAAPTPGSGGTDVPLLLVAAAAALAAEAGAVLWARRPGAGHRALVLGLASGAGFGVVGLLLKLVVGAPVAHWLLDWPVYALLVVGAATVATSQSAYRAGTLAQSLPAMTAAEPVVAIGLAGSVFGEHLAGGVPQHAGQVLGLLALVSGIALLSRAQAHPEPALRHGDAGGGDPGRADRASRRVRPPLPVDSTASSTGAAGGADVAPGPASTPPASTPRPPGGGTATPVSGPAGPPREAGPP